MRHLSLIAFILVLVVCLSTSPAYAGDASDAHAPFPSPPRNLRATLLDGRVRFEWDAPMVTGDAQLTGYEVRINAAEWRTTAAQPMLITPVDVPGASITVAVRALVSAGPGAQSSITVKAAPPPAQGPADVKKVSATPVDRAVRLSWAAPEGGADHYLIRANGLALTFSKPEALIENLKNSVPLTLEICAVKGGLEGPATLLTVTPGAAPSAPMALTLHNTSAAGLHLSWRAPQSALPILGYAVRFAGQTQIVPAAQINLPASLSAGETVSVCAVTDAGEGQAGDLVIPHP